MGRARARAVAAQVMPACKPHASRHATHLSPAHEAHALEPMQLCVSSAVAGVVDGVTSYRVLHNILVVSSLQQALLAVGCSDCVAALSMVLPFQTFSNVLCKIATDAVRIP